MANIAAMVAGAVAFIECVRHRARDHRTINQWRKRRKSKKYRRKKKKKSEIIEISKANVEMSGKASK